MSFNSGLIFIEKRFSKVTNEVQLVWNWSYNNPGIKEKLAPITYSNFRPNSSQKFHM